MVSVKLQLRWFLPFKIILEVIDLEKVILNNFDKETHKVGESTCGPHFIVTQFK